MKNLKNNLMVIAMAIILGIVTAVMAYPPADTLYKCIGVASLFWLCMFMPAIKID
jgi:threonine/homoserine/homoserine lactone efflux protein